MRGRARILARAGPRGEIGIAAAGRMLGLEDAFEEKHLDVVNGALFFVLELVGCGAVASGLAGRVERSTGRGRGFQPVGDVLETDLAGPVRAEGKGDAAALLERVEPEARLRRTRGVDRAGNRQDALLGDRHDLGVGQSGLELGRIELHALKIGTVGREVLPLGAGDHVQDSQPDGQRPSLVVLVELLHGLGGDDGLFRSRHVGVVVDGVQPRQEGVDGDFQFGVAFLLRGDANGHSQQPDCGRHATNDGCHASPAFLS